MFTAVCKDDNNSIFPLAWGIGDVENDSSWLWFFTKFKQVYRDRPGLVIVSDRHPSIAKAIREIYPGLDPANDTVYTVLDGDKNGVVDLQARTCSCRRFQLEQLPCVHVMIAIRHSKRDVYDFCSEYYNSSTWKATYAGVVYPLPHQGDWVIPNEVHDVKVLPLDIRSVSG
ncbi:hypothetical protein UlMin_014364 [Ulmus minor]